MRSASRARKATSSGVNSSGRNNQPSRLKNSICCSVSFMTLSSLLCCHSGMTAPQLRRLKLRAPGCVGLDPCRRELGRERVDRAAHFIELADTFRIELDDFKAATAALGDQALPVQQMQRMGNRLARHPEFFGEFVLPNAMPWRQRAVGDRLQNTRVDLIDQVRKRIQRDHVDRPLEYGIPYSLGQSSSRVKPGDAKRV